MIPRAYITEWRAHAPWPLDQQVEQDLVIARALVELFAQSQLSATLAFRGGTALHKLYFAPAVRYSEDIDLVQMISGPIGPVLDQIRQCLDPWLGAAQYKQSRDMATLKYRFDAESQPVVPLRLKVEINTREPFTVLGLVRHPFAVESRWFRGRVDIPTFELAELLATKFRALYRRRKGRDAFDLALALSRAPSLAPAIVDCFIQYESRGGGTPPTRAEFAQNLAEKRSHPGFLSDMAALLPIEHRGYDAASALDQIERQLVDLLPQ